MLPNYHERSNDKVCPVAVGTRNTTSNQIAEFLRQLDKIFVSALLVRLDACRKNSV